MGSLSSYFVLHVILALFASSSVRGLVESSGKYRIELCKGWTGCSSSSEFIGFNNHTCSAGVPPVSKVYGDTVGPLLRSSGVSKNWRTWVVNIVSKKADRTVVTIKNDFGQAKCTNHYIDDYSEKKESCKGTVWSDRVHMHKYPGQWVIKAAKGTNGKCFNIINHQKPAGCLRYLSANDDCKERHLRLVERDDGKGLQQWKFVRVGGSSPSPSLPGSTCVSTGPSCADCCKSKFEKMDGSFLEDPTCILADEFPQCAFELGPSPPPTPSRSAPKLISTSSGSPTVGTVVFEPEQGAVMCTMTATPQGEGPSVSTTVDQPLSFPTTTVSLHNLSPNTVYSIQLVCEDDKGEQESSSNKKALHTTASDVQPGIVNLHPTSTTSAAFNIVAPRGSECEVEKYDVLWGKPGATTSKMTRTGVDVTLTGLLPGNTYEIAVVAICKGGSVTKKSTPAFVTVPLVPPVPPPPGPQQPTILDKAPTFHTISVFGAHPEVSVHLPSGIIPMGAMVVVDVDCTNGLKTTASAPASAPETDIHLPVGLPPDTTCTFTGYTKNGSTKSPTVTEVRVVPTRTMEAPSLVHWIPNYQTGGGTVVVVAPQSPNCTITQYKVTGTESKKSKAKIGEKRQLLQSLPTFSLTTPSPGTLTISNSVNYGASDRVLNMEVIGMCADGSMTPSGYLSVNIASCPVISNCDTIDNAGGMCKCQKCASGYLVSATGYSCSTAPSPPPPPSLFYLDTNGVTVKCPNAPLGSMAVVNGVTYTKRDRIGLEALIGSANEAQLATSCISGVDNLAAMFERLPGFNVDIRSWDTSSVTTMSFLFRAATAFNQDISSWNTSAVTSMNSLFEQATAFNQNIGNWDTRKVTDMYSIFNGASVFNRNIGGWNTGAVQSLSLAFRDASAFNQDLSSWTAAPGFCSNFADNANAWLAAYGGSSIRSTPPLSPSMIAAGCGP